MTEFFENTQNVFRQFGEGVSLILEIVSVLCIVAGLINSGKIFLQLKKQSGIEIYNRVRLQFGRWLLLALEYQLASDIVKTTTTPTYENLIIVGVVAVIRTFLNYFLNKEIKEEIESDKINA